MVLPQPMNPTLLSTAADCVNPVLGGVLVLVALFHVRDTRRSSRWGYLARSMAGLAVVYLLHNLDAHLHLWARFNLDYSTHTAVAVSLVTSIAVADPYWLIVLLPLLGAYGWLMTNLGYHTPADIFAAGVAAFLGTWVWHLRPRRHKWKPASSP